TMHVSRSLADGMDVTVQGGSIRVTGATLRQLIELASGLSATVSAVESSLPPLQIAGAPDWIERRRFDVEAPVRTGRIEDVREAIHTLLEERFRLAARYTRQPGAVLAPGPDGSEGVDAWVLTIERVEQPRADF